MILHNNKKSSLKKRLLGVFIYLPILTACTSPPPEDQEAVLPGPLLPSQIETYSGILPCSDCAGIHTSLSLFPDSLAYRLTEAMPDSGYRDAKKTRSGIYQIEYGLGEDSLAVVIRLDPASDQPDFFLLLGDSALEKLDAARNHQTNPIAYRLRKNRQSR